MDDALFFTFLAIFGGTAVVTLLGITKRIDIDELYLKPLFGSLLIEVVGAVIMLFTVTDFFGKSAEAFIHDLPGEVRARTPEEASHRIAAMSKELARIKNTLPAEVRDENIDRVCINLGHYASECGKTKNELAANTAFLSRQNEQIRSLKEELAFYEGLRGNVLLLFAKLNLDIARGGDFINLEWHSEEKREIAQRIHESMAVIGELSGTYGDSPEEVRKALIDYQKRHGLSNAEGYFGRETLNSMITVYLHNMRNSL